MSPPSFTIELSASTEGKYRIAARPASGGEIQVVANNPFRSQEIEGCLEILSRRSVMPLEQAKVTRQFGQKLFNFLIGNHTAIHDAYLVNQRSAGQQGTYLKLAVDSTGSLLYLPWELVRDPNRDFLALSGNMSFVRTTSWLDQRAPVPLLLPLRVLAIMAIRNAEHEWRRLEQATDDLRRTGQLRLDRLHNASLSALRLRLLAEDYHIVHYIGLAQVDDQTGQPSLVMGGEEHNVISPDDLSRELYPESTVRLLILTPCQRSYQAMTTLAGNVRIPVALTLQFPISRSASILFLREFYGALLQGMPIDAVVSRSRRILANHLQNGEWAAPVLFAHSQTVKLFRPISGYSPLQPTH